MDFLYRKKDHCPICDPNRQKNPSSDLAVHMTIKHKDEALTIDVLQSLKNNRRLGRKKLGKRREEKALRK